MDSPYLDVQIMASVDKNSRSFFGNKKVINPETEQKLFRRMTSNSCVIMSKGVMDAFGQPLPNRVNMVISPEDEHDAPGYMVAENLYEAIRTARMFPSIFVVGGSDLYKESFEYANTLWLIKSNKQQSTGGEKFPKIPKHYELEETQELDEGLKLERWTNPERIIKLYKAPKRY
jgi:dihydrofolate reductase